MSNVQIPDQLLYDLYLLLVANLDDPALKERASKQVEAKYNANLRRIEYASKLKTNPVSKDTQP